MVNYCHFIIFVDNFQIRLIGITEIKEIWKNLHRHLFKRLIIVYTKKYQKISAREEGPCNVSLAKAYE